MSIDITYSVKRIKTTRSFDSIADLFLARDEAREIIKERTYSATEPTESAKKAFLKAVSIYLTKTYPITTAWTQKTTATTTFRFYEDRTVVHQDDWREYDNDPQARDYTVYIIPDEIVDHIQDNAAW